MRLLVGFFVAVALVGVAPAAAATSSRIAPTRELALLYSEHIVRARPDRHSRVVRRISAHRPLTGERTALPVLAHRVAPNGRQWLRVLLPGRPNGHSGWIVRRATGRTSTPWHLVVSLSARRVAVYRHGRPLRTLRAVVGSSGTPTPAGLFFVEEAIELRPGDVGAPYALALSARSTVLQEFDGGPGQIAFHGLRNVGGVLGTAASHGCVRLENAAMRWLVTRIGPGVPVTVRD